MALRRFAHKPPTNLCAQWGADDGVDPRLVPNRPQAKATNRKALQLCRQVQRALAAALEGEILRDLSIRAVVPAPDSSRLLAIFDYHGSEMVATAAILAALDGAQARLRREMAQAIHRKKTPELTFQVLRA